MLGPSFIKDKTICEAVTQYKAKHPHHRADKNQDILHRVLRKPILHKTTPNKLAIDDTNQTPDDNDSVNYQTADKHDNNGGDDDNGGNDASLQSNANSPD
eukprot:3038802-Ditylum_brightwellii.AAC.1